MALAIQPIKPAFFLGSNISNPKVLGSKVEELIDAVNKIMGGNDPFPEHITDTTQSTSTSTGALIVDGGVGIVKDVFIGGAATISSTVTGGSFTTAQGVTAGTGFDTSTGALYVGDGTAAAPSQSFHNQSDMGQYKVSATQLGFSVAGALQGMFSSATGGLVTGTISEQVTGVGIKINQATIRKYTTFAVNTSATVSAANFNKGYFTSTSAAGVTLTLPTAANIATQFGAVQGTVFDFFVDNIAGANNVTVAVGAGITAAKQVSDGDTAVDINLVVANGAATGLGHFRLVFSSASAATLHRLA